MEALYVGVIYNTLLDSNEGIYVYIRRRQYIFQPKGSDKEIPVNFYVNNNKA